MQNGNSGQAAVTPDTSMHPGAGTGMNGTRTEAEAEGKTMTMKREHEEEEEQQGAGSVAKKKAKLESSEVHRLARSKRDLPVLDEEEEHSLSCTEEEARKLRSVLRMLDKHGLGSEPLPDEAGVPSLLEALDVDDREKSGWPHALSTIEFYLDLATSSLQSRIRARAAKGKGRVSITLETASTLEDVSRVKVTLSALIDELKNTAAKTLGKRRVKRATPKYALHRSLGGLDIFSSPAPFSLQDDAFQTLKDTDVVALHPPLQSSTDNSSRLRDYNSASTDKIPPRPLVERVLPVEPVTMLYYGPYASFAPTHDSSMATMSYMQSVRLNHGRSHLAEWNQRPLPSLPATEQLGPVREPVQLGVFDSQSIEDEDIKAFIRHVEDSSIIDKRLQENARLLQLLQEYQYSRLRQTASAMVRDNNEDGTPAAKSAEDVKAVEHESAQRVLATLKSIANARPRLIAQDGSSVQSMLSTEREFWAKVKHEVVQDVQLPYYGTLPPDNARAVPETALARVEVDDSAIDPAVST